jgi:NAD(P)-dependent dehydrogenase (short-subunit alcohol dehydrogenase family)
VTVQDGAPVTGTAPKEEDEMEEPWTTKKVPDLSGKVAIVTGANSGTGYHTAVALAQKGAAVIMACRNLEKGEAALARLQAEAPVADAALLLLDLASLVAVRRFAEAFRAGYERLDILVNNAGIMMVPYGQTEDGFERQFGTNHLGHFALTGLLFARLVSTRGSRVVTVSSNGHRFGKMDFDNLMFAGKRGYSPIAAYGRSKLANLLFTTELQRRFEAMDAPSLALAAHPGLAATNLANHLFARWHLTWLRPVMSLVMQPAAMGALPIIRAAVDPQARGGAYYGPGGRGERRGYPVVVQANDAANDPAAAQKLWAVSAQLTGVTYGQQEPVGSA